jgi:hypothetical protein
MYVTNQDEMVTIPVKEYEELINNDKRLDSLISCGVDNWAGWDDACQYCKEEYQLRLMDVYK